MSRFPRTEAEITALALLVVEGLTQAPDDFPAPPVPPSELQAKLHAYNAAHTIQRHRQRAPSARYSTARHSDTVTTATVRMGAMY
jgi:hypothetical protein